MSKAKIGAYVEYCGHSGSFIADIWHIGDVNVVVASREVDPGNLLRGKDHCPTHRLRDFPKAGYWNPRKGIFVVPADQVEELKERRNDR